MPYEYYAIKFIDKTEHINNILAIVKIKKNEYIYDYLAMAYISGVNYPELDDFFDELYNMLSYADSDIDEDSVDDISDFILEGKCNDYKGEIHIEEVKIHVAK